MRSSAIALTAVLLAGCGGSGLAQPTPTPTAPATTAAPATSPPTGEVTLTTTLSAASEVPPVTGAEASGSGTATVIIRTARNNAGQLSAATAEFDIQLSGFPPGTIVTGAHIHDGVAGVNGPVLVNTGITADAPLELADGTGTIARAGIVVDLEVAQRILEDPEEFYVNVHSTNNPGGVVRGQLSE
ncbi:MAG TPA: CHRD domain-containing protein [Candidatus Limnocylindrales bacterium]|nr:CHRD domain-containing protein [Candidatus Limnocylindrales bacterium]